jgi:hypothetical protein
LPPPRACPAPAAAAPTVNVPAVPARRQVPAAPVPVVPAPRPAQADPVLPQAQVVPVRVHRVPAVPVLLRA